MNTHPIQSALLTFNAQGQPSSPAHGVDGDPQQAGLVEAAADFVSRIEWPESNVSPFTVLDTRFALGQRFLAAWLSWQKQPEPKANLDFIAIEARPFGLKDLARMQALLPHPEWAALAAVLQGQWPILTPNLHRLTFEKGRVSLSLALGEPKAWLRELVATVNAIVVDPEFDALGCKALARLAAPGAVLLARRNSPETPSLQAALQSAGFALQFNSISNPPYTLARYRPMFTPRLMPGRAQAHRAGWGSTDRHALIVGAGLAGCATALALSRQGWRCKVIDKRSGPAQETSGNAAGLFHGVVHGHDGHHGRFGRAAALYGARWIRDALSQQADQDAGHPIGQMNGLLRLELELDDVDKMRATLAQLGLPSGYVQALDGPQVSHLSGLALRHPAWFYPQGGWVQPGPLCVRWLDESQAAFLGDTQAESITQEAGLWHVLGHDGQAVARAPVLVLANAQNALHLLRPWMRGADWTVQAVRGQISQFPLALVDAIGLKTPRLPLAGAGYLLPRTSHGLLFGATSQYGDTDASVRLSDHRENLGQLEKLCGHALPAEVWASLQWQGRTGWRCVTKDRLPIVGAVPDPSATAATTDQPRLVPRLSGLHVCMALGSRGITWAPLAAEVVACGISGAAMPLESSLLDAIDPARFLARAARQAR